MRNIIITIGIILITLNVFCQKQSDLNSKAKSEYDKINKELYRIYNDILQDYKSDSVFICCLIDSQNLWIKFRDAQVKMKYPAYPESYGSIEPMCIYYYEEELTILRIKELRPWKERIEEGDVCSGSIKLISK